MDYQVYRQLQGCRSTIKMIGGRAWFSCPPASATQNVGLGDQVVLLQSRAGSKHGPIKGGDPIWGGFVNPEGAEYRPPYV